MYRFFWVFLFLGLMSFAQSTKDDKTTAIKIYERESVQVRSYDFNTFAPYLHRNDEFTYIINFWATWCLPCIKELPHFEALNQKYSDKNVKVILVSLDMPKKVETSLISFIKKNKLQSEVIHLDDPDANAWIEKVDKNWSGAIPATIIYNAKTRKFYERSFTFEELENELITTINP